MTGITIKITAKINSAAIKVPKSILQKKQNNKLKL